jgi:hypothetical protein
MRWAGYVSGIGDRRCAYRVWWGDVKERNHLEDLGVDERILLKPVFKKWDGELWSGLIWPRIGTCGGLL